MTGLCVFSEVSKRGWREGVGDERAPKYSENCSPDLCSPSPKGGIGKRAQKRGLNLWHRKDLLAPTPSARQPLFETSDPFFPTYRLSIIRNAEATALTKCAFWRGLGSCVHQNRAILCGCGGDFYRCPAESRDF